MIQELLRQMPMFADLPETELEYLAEVLHVREFPAHAAVFTEGGRDEQFYILVDGEALVYKSLGEEQERYLALIGRGALIGEMGLFSQTGTHTASVRARTPLRLLEMRRLEFDQLLHRQPGLAYQLIQMLSRRLEQSENITISELREKNRQLTQAYLELQATQAQLVEKEKLEYELSIARNIQGGILPQQMPLLPGYDFGAVIVPARLVGGDFYDFITLTDGKLGVVVGDVSDKGMPAALFMAVVYSLIRVEARRCSSPAETLLEVNRHLLDIQSTNMFATALYGVLDPVNHSFSYARAGHPYPLQLNAAGEKVDVNGAAGMPLGLFKDLALVERQIGFMPGETLLLYSDGLSDMMNVEGMDYGHERVVQVACQNRLEKAQAICDGLLRSAEDFGQPLLHQDDITIVAIKCL